MNNIQIDKSKTAIVVIDLQKGIASFETHPYTSKEVIGNTAQLLKSFRKNNMPVFLVRVTPSPDGKDSLQPITDTPAWRQTPKANWAEIVSELGPEPGDFIITKHQWGAFYGTELDLEFRRRGITTMVLCGISTNIGVESTARFAYEFGFRQVFAEDAMGSAVAESHNAAVQFIFRRMGRVRKTADIIGAIG